ncbi:MAG TPA: hypothetical protein VK897_08435 [Anaerolineales bacterium]|nr:hypothetical protein [Anaerolineales bacterium]
MSERIYELQAAQTLHARQRGQGLAALNSLFRSGTVPSPTPDGRYQGKLLAIQIAPGLTQLAELLAGIWMPWLGKTFDSKRQSGENLLIRASYPLARIFNPLYRGFRYGDKASYRAFAFRTYIAPGLMDTDRTVLKIDYNLKENPALTVRRVLDELVQLDDRLYLGKAHVHWWWGQWQTFAYFRLTK